MFSHRNWIVFISVWVTVHFYWSTVCFFLNGEVRLHCAISWPQWFLCSFWPLTCKCSLSAMTTLHVILQSLYAALHPVNIPPTFCPSGLPGGRTVTAQWFSQGRSKREAGTSTQVRYLTKHSLNFMSKPHQTHQKQLPQLHFGTGLTLYD